MMFLGMSWRNFSKNLFYTGRYDLPELLVKQLVDFSTAVTRNPLTVWSRITDHRKAESCLLNQYLGHPEFWPIRD
jgi:hypothetical protein